MADTSLRSVLRRIHDGNRDRTKHIEAVRQVIDIVESFRGALVGPDVGDGRTREIHEVLASLLQVRLSNPLKASIENAGWSLADDVFLTCAADTWAEQVGTRWGASASLAPASGFVEWFISAAEELPCSVQHPLFEYLRLEASASALAQVFAAELLCDWHFGYIVALLLPGMDGEAETEIAENVWAETGAGEWRDAHRLERDRMMRAVGVEEVNARSTLEFFVTEELEHFNAYVLNGLRRPWSRRLVGMLACTELLVPDQQEAVLEGWRRVGVDENSLRYVTMHIEGDREHGRGWVERVIRPIADSDLARRELVLGMHMHSDILTRLYDRLLADIKRDQDCGVS